MMSFSSELGKAIKWEKLLAIANNTDRLLTLVQIIGIIRVF